MRYVSAREMMDTFHISKTTLNRWKMSNKVKYQQLSYRKIIYDIDSVSKEINFEETEKQTVLYFRISPEKQDNIKSIVEFANKYAIENNFKIDNIYTDVLNYRGKVRPAFKKMLEDINIGNIKTVCVLNERNMSYADFVYFEKIFSFYGVNIVVLNLNQNIL